MRIIVDKKKFETALHAFIVHLENQDPCLARYAVWLANDLYLTGRFSIKVIGSFSTLFGTEKKDQQF